MTKTPLIILAAIAQLFFVFKGQVIASLICVAIIILLSAKKRVNSKYLIAIAAIAVALVCWQFLN